MNLKDVRKKLDLTQVTAARIAGVNSITWSRWELGKAKPLPRSAAIVALMDRAAQVDPCHLAADVLNATQAHISACPRCQVARIGAINRGL